MAKPYQCGHCTTRWGGDLTCHCGRCHETFGNLAAFDRHLVLDDARRVTTCPTVDDRSKKGDLVFARNSRGYLSLAAALARGRDWGDQARSRATELVKAGRMGSSDSLPANPGWSEEGD